MDRFDLEQQIFGCWNIVDELKVLSEAVCEKNLSTDEVTNILMGLERLYQLKFDKLFLTFEKLVKSGSLEGRDEVGQQASLFDDNMNTNRNNMETNNAS